MSKLILSLFLFFLCASCATEQKQHFTHKLVATNRVKTFELDAETRYNPFYLYTFRDEAGKTYLSFLNYRTNQILFYDWDTSAFLFKVELDKEGSQGVGLPSGYYIHDFRHIYVTSYSYFGLIKVDTTGHVVQKIPYGKTPDGYQVQASYAPSSQPYIPPVIIGDKLYITQQAAAHICPLERTPLSVAIDTHDNSNTALPLTYKSVLSEAQIQTGETRFSRTFDGRRFIYSFYTDENLLIASVEHDTIQRVSAQSGYIENPAQTSQVPVEQRAKANLEIPRYGNLLHDPYRNLYYRFAYPQTELDSNIDWRGKAVYGRKKFSVLILDKDLNVIGETLFPEATYNPYACVVTPEGLYISKDYKMLEGTSEDFTNFELWKVEEE
ncbi:MAG: DUF4221 family protein [Bacteroides sp.]|nr:DUF4221 family protein [Bacteroides sp.]